MTAGCLDFSGRPWAGGGCRCHVASAPGHSCSRARRVASRPGYPAKPALRSWPSGGYPSHLRSLALAARCACRVGAAGPSASARLLRKWRCRLAQPPIGPAGSGGGSAATLKCLPDPGASLRDRATLSSPLCGLAHPAGIPRTSARWRSLRAALAGRLTMFAAPGR